MNIALIPSQRNWFDNQLFNLENGRDNILDRYILLKETLMSNNHEVQTIDKYDYADIDVIIFHGLTFALPELMKGIRSNPNVKIINDAREPVVVDSLNSKPILDSCLFDFVLTWNDNWIDDFKYIEDKSFCYNKMINSSIEYKDKKYLCLINYYKSSNVSGELYSERLNTIKHFGPRDKIDLFGYGWDKCPDSEIRNVYKGPVESKADTLKHYKFSIAYENCSDDGYICEKIFDSFTAKSIPIFCGARNVKYHIPENTFIDLRDFDSYESLERFLDEIDEVTYNRYISNIITFMESDNFRKFTSRGFADAVSKAIARISDSPPTEKKIERIRRGILQNVFQYPKLFWRSKRFTLRLLTTYCHLI